MRIIEGKDPIWETDKYDVILVGTSIYCMLTNGFQSKIRFKYPNVDKENNKTPYGDKRKLGTRLTIYPIVDEQPTISLCYIANYPNSKRVFVDYDALENVLATANAEFKGEKVLTTLLGASQFDGNGDIEKIKEIIEKNTKDLDIDVYVYEQIPRVDEIAYNENKLRKYRDKGGEENEQLWKNRDKILEKLYLK